MIQTSILLSKQNPDPNPALLSTLHPASFHDEKNTLARTGCWSRCGSMVPNASSMNTKALVCFSIQLPNWGLQQTFRSFSRGQYQDWDCRRFLPSPPHGKEKFPAPVETAGRKYAARKILPIFRTALRQENRKHPQVLRFQQLRDRLAIVILKVGKSSFIIFEI